MLAILWPRAWEFTASPRDVIATYVEGDEPLELAAIHRDLALHMQASYLSNQSGLERLIVYFRLASGLLTAEVVAWVVDLASKT